MNKIFFYLAFLFVGLFVATSVGCTSDPEEVCEQYEACENTATTCCTDETSCYYEYNGVEYPDTEKGLEDLLAAMCPQSSKAEIRSMRSELKSKTSKLINEARQAALCN
ncbi:hypothetical protein [Carboxylicivirga marina]|uniref:Uncharacterized protein n=1 Tax=Carboxylicivirga marina TaxID=2800988 RepID=A0ABS1HFV3_9BACT|nr:hypothetical protein [Carboxylicivirga marina]MBK3516521.1 hypothetical protein [Carboxylicivirga marina]